MIVLSYVVACVCFFIWCLFVFQAEDGIRDLVRSRGLGDVYKRQGLVLSVSWGFQVFWALMSGAITDKLGRRRTTLLLSLIHI